MKNDELRELLMDEAMERSDDVSKKLASDPDALRLWVNRPSRDEIYGAKKTMYARSLALLGVLVVIAFVDRAQALGLFILIIVSYEFAYYNAQKELRLLRYSRDFRCYEKKVDEFLKERCPEK